jgi:hypothetical protein
VFEGIPQTVIFYNPATQSYGFSTRFPGKRTGEDPKRIDRLHNETRIAGAEDPICPALQKHRANCTVRRNSQ